MFIKILVTSIILPWQYPKRISTIVSYRATIDVSDNVAMNHAQRIPSPMRHRLLVSRQAFQQYLDVSITK